MGTTATPDPDQHPAPGPSDGGGAPLHRVALVSPAMRALAFEHARSGLDCGQGATHDHVPIWRAAQADPALAGREPIQPWLFVAVNRRRVRAVDGSDPDRLLVDGPAAFLYAQSVDPRIRDAAEADPR